MPNEIRLSSTDSLPAAVAAAPSGARIVVPPGTYEGHVVIDKPLELTGDGSAGYVELTGALSGIQITSPSVSIDNLNIRGNSAFLCLLWVRADNVGISHCSFIGGMKCVSLGGSNIALTDCTISGSAIALQLVRVTQVIGCQIHDNRKGIEILGSGHMAEVIDCDIYDNSGDGVLVCDQDDKTIAGEGSRFYRCKIRNNGANGIKIRTAQGCWVRECEISHNAQTQVHIEGDAYIQSCDIHHGPIGIQVEQTADPNDSPSISHTAIHDVRTGVLCKSDRPRDYSQLFEHVPTVSFLSCAVYRTSGAAVHTTGTAELHHLHNLIAHNTNIGISASEESSQTITACRIANNQTGVGFGRNSFDCNFTSPSLKTTFMASLFSTLAALDEALTQKFHTAIY